MKYNYYKAVKYDVLNAIRDYDFSEFETLEEFEEKLNEDLWIDDSVTGNGSGSYTFNRWKAEEYVHDNFDLMHEAAEEFCQEEEFKTCLWDEEYENIDVSIRCYLLNGCIAEALEEIKEEFEKVHENDEEEE